MQKKRNAIVCSGIIIIVVLFFMGLFIGLFPGLLFTFFYLFIVSFKVHSKLLSSVIAVSGLLNGVLLAREYTVVSLVLLFLTLAILFVLLVVLQQKELRSNSDEIQADIQPANVCPNCGAPASGNIKYCTKCGSPLNNK